MEKKQRSSNFEVLRIIAMLMIVNYHIVYHCVREQLTKADSIARMGNDWFNQPQVYKQLWALDTFMPLGNIGNVIFILLSGYFLIQRGRKTEYVRIGKNLLLQMAFAVLSLVFLSGMIYALLYEQKGIYVELINVTDFNSLCWFVGYYYAIILTGALFLNTFLKKLSQKQYLGFLMALFLLSQIGWTGNLLEGVSSGLRIFCNGICMYALGGYISKYNPFEKIRTYGVVLLIGLAFLLLYVSTYYERLVSVEEFMQKGAKGTYYAISPQFSNYHCIVIFVGVALFELFRRVKMPVNRGINFFGKSTFMVYLIHDNPLFYSLWNTKDWIKILYHHPLRFMGEVFQWSVGVFVIGVGSYCIYLFFSNICAKYKYLILK